MLKTFKLGGVHPKENKLTADKKIIRPPMPKTVSIAVAQHIGSPATVIVKKGDQVKVGTHVANSSGFVSSNIHSSVSGTVVRIDDVMMPSGYKKTAVIIDVENDEWDESIDRTPDLITETPLNAKAIIQKILEAGIVGLGGATFPTNIKLSPPPGMKAEILLINGVECEPYLTADHRLMIEKGDEVMVGTSLLMKALNVSKAVIGIENNKPDAIKNLTQLARKYKGIEVCALQVKYPQGGEKQLINAITGKEVPSGQLPISVGAVVDNVGTAFAVYEAVMKNKPLFERVVTVTGKGLKSPSNFLVRIGTPVKDLIEAAGGLPESTGKVINGGPMMGKAITTLDVPVQKGTSGILVMPESESFRSEEKPCIRCGKCISACPMGLEPYLLMTLSAKKIWDRSETSHILDCMECGSCAYTCPSSRPLLDFIRLGKSTVSKIIRSRKQ